MSTTDHPRTDHPHTVDAEPPAPPPGPRRSPAARSTRVAVAAAAVVGLLLALGVARSTGSSTTPDAAEPPAPAPRARPTGAIDRLVDVHGARMHVRCDGVGATTVVLIAGFESPGDVWDAVTPTVSRQARVCSSDRFGTGTSAPAPATTQTFATQAADLRTALTSLGEPGPYLVVGHSFGGAEAVAFAAMYLAEVEGLVLVDASPTGWPAAVCAVPDDGTPSSQTFGHLCSYLSTPAANAEHLDAPAAFAEVAQIDTLHDLPVAVLTAAEHPHGLSPAEEARLADVWRAGQDHWASLTTSSRLVTVDHTGHNVQVDQPGAVIGQIEQLLR